MAIYRLGFVMEQTLGHVTHHHNLRQWVSRDGAVVPEWMPVEMGARDVWERLPLNWTLRASLRARSQVRAALRRGPLDGLFFHTQVTALFAAACSAGRPHIVSLDATPINLDSVGAAYGHAPSKAPFVENLKNRRMRRVFSEASHLTTWNEWAKGSLVSDYGIAAEKVTVVSPGIDLGRWRFERFPRPNGHKPRLLFVGGDFRRKGGQVLLDVFGARLQGKCELDIVTREEVDLTGLDGARVHHGLTSNCPELLSLYENADIFVLPTFGECHPIATIESLAAGLPVVSTRIGAIPEIVTEGKTGFLVPPADGEALGDAIERLVADPEMAMDMAWQAQKDAAERFDGQVTYRMLVEMVKRCVDGK